MNLNCGKFTSPNSVNSFFFKTVSFCAQVIFFFQNTAWVSSIYNKKRDYWNYSKNLLWFSMLPYYYFFFENLYFLKFFQGCVQIYMDCFSLYRICTDSPSPRLILGLYFQCSCCYKEKRNVQLHFKMEFIIYFLSWEMKTIITLCSNIMYKLGNQWSWLTITK